MRSVISKLATVVCVTFSFSNSNYWSNGAGSNKQPRQNILYYHFALRTGNFTRLGAAHPHAPLSFIPACVLAQNKRRPFSGLGDRPSENMGCQQEILVDHVKQRKFFKHWILMTSIYDVILCYSFWRHILLRSIWSSFGSIDLYGRNESTNKNLWLRFIVYDNKTTAFVKLSLLNFTLGYALYCF